MKSVVYEKQTTQIYWDKYNAFHRNISGMPHGFIVFQTGEIILDAWGISNDWRNYYSSGNIKMLFASELNTGKIELEDGTPVPKAWLQDGGQTTLLIDLDHNVIVNADRNTRIDGAKISNLTHPSHLACASVLWNNSDVPPVAKHDIEISRPREFTRDQKEWQKELLTLCAVSAKLSGKGYAGIMNWAESIVNYTLDPKEVFKAMNNDDRVKLGSGGYNWGRSKSWHDKLVYVPKK